MARKTTPHWVESQQLQIKQSLSSKTTNNFQFSMFFFSLWIVNKNLKLIFSLPFFVYLQSITSPDPTAYVAKARVTRPTPPPPPYNPMQFVQIKPCNLYQTAQEQLKKAEEVKKIKEIRKEEPEDWQNVSIRSIVLSKLCKLCRRIINNR